MARLSDISSGMFDGSCDVIVRIVMSADIAYRKNHNFGKQALSKSKFSKQIFNLCSLLNNDELSQILGTEEINSENDFIEKFTKTECTYHVNYHDQKMCTVEFCAKYKTKIERLLKIDDSLLEEMHLEVMTPVGTVQI
tara:strand:+ start:207 stop:620 length:414 start_codon:yes stop_codon:yes gene_type:complete